MIRWKAKLLKFVDVLITDNVLFKIDLEWAVMDANLFYGRYDQRVY
jgi:hypothetical protein